MRYSILFSIIILSIFSSCKKDKYTTKPQLKYESANKTVFRQGDVIVLKLTFTDAEGDLQDSIYDEKFVASCVNSSFGRKFKLPTFPTTKNQKGEITVTYGYNNNNNPNLQQILSPQCNRNDTCIFKFVLKDKVQNKSDTAYSEKIVLIK